MTAVAKFLRPFGMTAKVEAAYGDPATTLSPTTDAVQLADRQDWTFDYLSNGDRKTKSSAIPGALVRARPSGRSGKGSIPFELKGKGSAYTTAADFPPNIHAFLRASGYAAGFGGGVWQYSPNALGVAGASLAIGLYGRGVLQLIRGVLCSLTIEAADGGPVMVTFDANGIAPELPTDVSLPALVYPAVNQLPVQGQGATIAIGDFTTAVVRSWKFTQGRKVDGARQNLNLPGGHAGFSPGDSDVMLEVTIEETPLVSGGITASGINPYELRDNAQTVYPVSIAVGGATGSGTSCKIVLGLAQLADATPGEDGEIATTTLKFVPYSDGLPGGRTHYLEFS